MPFFEVDGRKTEIGQKDVGAEKWGKRKFLVSIFLP
jgi:hypothetical protein